MRRIPASQYMFLQRQALNIITHKWASGAVHTWLCHPGHECVDGCQVHAIPERKAALEFVELHQDDAAWNPDL